MDALEARLLPGTDEAVRNPVFSPDGQSVAYVVAQAGQLKRLALSGGAPVVIAEGIGPPWGLSWAADGTILVGQRQGVVRVEATGIIERETLPGIDFFGNIGNHGRYPAAASRVEVSATIL